MRNTKLAKRSAVTVAVVAAVALALTGCNASGGGSGNSAKGQTDLKLIMNPGPEANAMSKVMAAFNAGPGAKEKIHVAVDQLSRTDTYAKEATLMSTKSSNYDFYQTASYYIAQHAQYLEPMSLDDSLYFKSSLDSLNVSGTQYAIPLDPSVNMLFYRTDLISGMLNDTATFEKVSQEVLGKKLEPKSPDQWSWDDYVASAAYFTQKYNPTSPTKYGTELQAKNLVYNAMVWDDVLWGSGGGWLDSNGKPDLTSDAAKSAVNVYRTIYTAGLTSPDSDQAEFPETQAALTSGNAAFAIQWNAGYDQLNDAAQSPKTAGKIGIARVPGKHLSHVHTLAIGVNKYGKHIPQAKKFIQYLDAEAAMKAYVAAGGLASMPGALTSPDSASIVALQGILKDGTFAEPKLPRAFDIYTALANDLSGAWVGSTGVDSALQKANADITKLSKK